MALNGLYLLGKEQNDYNLVNLQEISLLCASIKTNTDNEHF